jgi:phospholipid/cholesterol/gamma-HCH transport system permease protein
MSGVVVTAPAAGRLRRGLAAIGRGTRRRAAFFLMLNALLFAVLRNALWPATWRRSARSEFHRALVFAIGGGLMTVVLTAGLAGLALVSQALYWLGTAGEEGLVGPILVTVLVRELTPVLIGLLMLGRSGAAALTELGGLRLSGQLRVLEGQGLDLFDLMVLPRAVAIAVSSFALGMVFVVVAMTTGFVTRSLLGQFNLSLLRFLSDVLAAMRTVDFIVFPAKMLLIGLLVALVPCLTALTADPREQLAELQSRSFLRGLLAVLVASLVLSLAA